MSVVACALKAIDLTPDFIPVLGFPNDAPLLPSLSWLAHPRPSADRVGALVRAIYQRAAPTRLSLQAADRPIDSGNCD